MVSESMEKAAAFSMLSDTIVAKLDRLPSNPGVYLFRGPEGCVLYIGKARHLRSRVRSYFEPGSSDMRYFIGLLSTELHDLETIVVDSEKEAAASFSLSTTMVSRSWSSVESSPMK